MDTWGGHGGEGRDMAEPVAGTEPAEAAPLSVAQQRVWREFMAATGMLNAHLETLLQRDAGMPVLYYQVLVRLSEAPDHTLRMSELAAACQASRSRLSHAVARMEASGWVRRSSCPTDKRGSFATLTADGLRECEQAAPGYTNAVRTNLFDVLTAEQVDALGEISSAITAALAGQCAAAAANEFPEEDAGATSGE